MACGTVGRNATPAIEIPYVEYELDNGLRISFRAELELEEHAAPSVLLLLRVEALDLWGLFCLV